MGVYILVPPGECCLIDPIESIRAATAMRFIAINTVEKVGGVAEW